ncbi:MAG: RagB/SusD family nutrient uptake outer membrane protein [Tunicatimonas sp.]|uniref:RagB/SusD family nutrient uptake outer membrane protein n=1 Tax=Tunicatimonas sp. TaxID=1940096 RepID=UPI003C745457
MKRIYNLVISIILVAWLSACEDDYLDRVPETDIGAERFFNTEEDLSIYINNLYDFTDFDQYNDDGGTDNAATTGNTELKTMMVGSPSSATISAGWEWEDLRTINFFLENFGKADIPQNRLDHYEGLARFFRARFYVEKVKRYSDVPWYSKTITSNDEELLMQPRDPRTLVVDSIMADFQFAAENVSGDGREGEVNAWVVKTYQARYALYEGTFRKYHPELSLQESADTYLQTARNVAKDIMNNGGFALHTTGNSAEDYHQLFISANLGSNPEVILVRAFENELLNSDFSATIFGNFEVSPTKDLLQSYLMADGSYYTGLPDYETNLFVEEFQNRDPRLNQTYAYPGWELIFTDTYSQGGGIYIQQLAKNFTGYHQIKGFVNDTDITVRNSIDVPILRFAEILLTYAEAKAELGELTQEDLDMTVNQLRDRAGMPNLTMNPPVDPIQAARYPNISSAQAAELLEIRRERRIEFALEGYRMDDLMRWHAGSLLESEPEGLYFPELGNYDLTGDEVADIKLIDALESIPEEREVNELGEPLIYYRAGSFGQDASLFLGNENSGTIQAIAERGTFIEPKYYYRPIPQSEVVLNPNLTQIFAWE